MADETAKILRELRERTTKLESRAEGLYYAAVCLLPPLVFLAVWKREIAGQVLLGWVFGGLPLLWLLKQAFGKNS